MSKVFFMDPKNQPIITLTKQQLEEFFDSSYEKRDLNNPLANEKVFIRIPKEWVGILLLLMKESLEVTKDVAMDSPPTGKIFFEQSIEFINLVIDKLNQATIKNEPIVSININFFELEEIINAIENEDIFLGSESKTLKPIINNISAEFHRVHLEREKIVMIKSI